MIIRKKVVPKVLKKLRKKNQKNKSGEKKLFVLIISKKCVFKISFASRHLVSFGFQDSHEFVTGLAEVEAEVEEVRPLPVRPVQAQIRPRKTPQTRPSRFVDIRTLFDHPPRTNF